MAEEDETEQGRHVAGAEDLRDHPVGERHGGQPQQADGDGKGEHRGNAGRGQDEQGDDDRAGHVQAAEQVFLAVPAAEHARGICADDVEEPDRGERPCAQLGRQSKVGDVRRQVRLDERHVEAADEESGDQQPIAAVTAGLAHRRAQGLVALPGRRLGAPGQGRGQRYDGEREKAEDDQGRLPAIGLEEQLARRHEEELAHGTRRRTQAEGPGAPVRRHHAAEGREHDGEGRAGDAEADEEPEGESERRRRAGKGDEKDAHGVDHGARRQHPGGAVSVGQRAGEGLRHAPHQVLDGDGEREHLAAPFERSRHRIEPQPEAGTHPEIEEGNQAAGENDQRRRTPVFESLSHDPLPDHRRFFSCPLADGRPPSRTIQRSSNGMIGKVL